MRNTRFRTKQDSFVLWVLPHPFERANSSVRWIVPGSGRWGGARATGPGKIEGKLGPRFPNCGGGLPEVLFDEVLEPLAPAGMAELAGRLRLDLADAFAGDAELLAHLFQGARAAVVEPEAQLEDLPLARRQGVEHPLQLLLQHRERGGLRRREGVLILDEVAEVAVLLLADRRLQRDRFLGDLDDLPHPLGRHLHDLADLLRGRLAAELLEQLPGDPDQLVDRLDHVDGDADRPRLVGEGPGDRLADPPGGVGAELVAFAPVELLDGADQPEVAFLDPV